MRPPARQLFLVVAVLTLATSAWATAQKTTTKPKPPFARRFLEVFLSRDHDADLTRIPGLSDDTLSLRGLKSIRVSVEELSPLTIAAGVSREDIQTDVELRLRTAGIKVVPDIDGEKDLSSAILYVNAMAMENGELILFHLDIELRQHAFLERNAKLNYNAATWSTGYLGRDDLAQFRQAVRDRTDEFCNEFLKANPKK